MDQHHFTEDQIEAALDRYRTALVDAREALEDDAPRDDIVKMAREILDDDDLDAHQLVQLLAAGEAGDPVWNVEEEILDED
jgi:phosphoenolpyruvate-protein kinase (PTS system EI component)